MQIKNENDGKRGSFFIEDGGKRIGEMQYIFAGPVKMVIIHTGVEDAYQGMGLGRDLVKAGVDYARAHHMKILPLCVFAKKIFDTTPEYSDVLF